MKRTFALLAALLLVVPACGKREVPKVRPLWPELYEIAAGDVPAVGQFIRYAAPSENGGGLDIAVTEYVPTKPGQPKVQLVGVVHVADAIYYENVQTVLGGADLVLYEAIKPTGMTMQDWKSSMQPSEPGAYVGFQQELAQWFGFTYQLDAIDYHGERFVHADMTVEEFVEEGGDEVLEDLPVELGATDYESLEPGIQGVIDRVRSFGRLLLSEPNPIRSLARRIMAEALGSLDDADTIGMFPGLNELIIDRRNEVAIEHLKKQLDKTDGTIAIFYGAAHNPDLEKRLEKLGYKRESAFWLRAWALRPPLKR